MLPATLHCPHCHADYQVPIERLQSLPEKVRCARCGQVFNRVLPTFPPPEVSDSESALSGRPVKILIVDDSRLFRSMLIDVLRPLQLECLQVESAESALPLMVREKPKLLVLDINLPGMSGVELMRMVRANPAIANTLILVVSSQAGTERAMSAAGVRWADAVMNKSFKPEQLLTQVRRLLGEVA